MTTVATGVVVDDDDDDDGATTTTMMTTMMATAQLVTRYDVDGNDDGAAQWRRHKQQ